MAEQITLIKVFVASPGDLKNERKELSKIISELNSRMAKDKQVNLELVKWETHTHPAMGRPQEQINKQIGEYDIFIGLMWKRFGSPTGEANSGTEEEFKNAYESWKKYQKPHILFYFSTKLFWPESLEEVHQLAKVFEFKDSLKNKGLLADYHTLKEFSDKIKHDLPEVVDELINKLKLSNKSSNFIWGYRNVVTVSSRNQQIDNDTVSSLLKEYYKKYTLKSFSSNPSSEDRIIYAVYTIDEITFEEIELLKQSILALAYFISVDKTIRVQIDEL